MGYAGIVNPGCLCYLNSSIQQLFMIPSFRESILSLSSSLVLESSSESFLSELLRLFQNLESARVANLRSIELLENTFRFSSHNIGSVDAIDPLPLSGTIWNPLRDADEAGEDKKGNYLDPDEQMDVSEFLSCFFTQLSSSLKSCHPLLQIGRSVCGEINNELTACVDRDLKGKNSSMRIKTNERFFYLSLKVGTVRAAVTSISADKPSSKYIGNLDDALDDFTRYQNVSAMWSRNEGESFVRELLPSANSCTLSAAALPPHLLIHLKRFRFDYEQMCQVKVNSRFEFPHEETNSSYLDLWRHTTEGRKEQEDDREWERNMREGNDCLDTGAEASDISAKAFCKYVLSGVIVHRGTALDGHYFSLVRERVEKRQNEQENKSRSRRGQQSRWFKMDDEKVSEFQLRNMKREAYGGEEGDDDVEGSSVGQNAFMLIYDRI